MQVSILEPKGAVWQGKAKEVRLPCEDGEVSVLDFHQPFFMRLKKGHVRFSVLGFRFSGLAKTEHRAPSTADSILIKEGLAFMQGNELTVFVEA